MESGVSGCIYGLFAQVMLDISEMEKGPEKVTRSMVKLTMTISPIGGVRPSPSPELGACVGRWILYVQDVQ
jgi:hypothetical protein